MLLPHPCSCATSTAAVIQQVELSIDISHILPAKVKYIGEEGESTPIAGAASICSPWDLLVSDYS
jgi:hypothetical protein